MRKRVPKLLPMGHLRWVEPTNRRWRRNRIVGSGFWPAAPSWEIRPLRGQLRGEASHPLVKPGDACSEGRTELRLQGSGQAALAGLEASWTVADPQA